MTKCPEEDQRTIQAWNKVYYPHSAVYLKVKILSLLLLLFSETTFQSLCESVDFYVIENGFIFYSRFILSELQSADLTPYRL